MCSACYAIQSIVNGNTLQLYNFKGLQIPWSAVIKYDFILRQHHEYGLKIITQNDRSIFQKKPVVLLMTATLTAGNREKLFDELGLRSSETFRLVR